MLQGWAGSAAVRSAWLGDFGRMGRRSSLVAKCRVAAEPRARMSLVRSSVAHFRNSCRNFGKLVGEGAAVGRIPGRIGDGLGVYFLQGLVANCLNSDSSEL